MYLFREQLKKLNILDFQEFNLVSVGIFGKIAPMKTNLKIKSYCPKNYNKNHSNMKSELNIGLKKKKKTDHDYVNCGKPSRRSAYLCQSQQSIETFTWVNTEHWAQTVHHCKASKTRFSKKKSQYSSGRSGDQKDLFMIWSMSPHLIVGSFTTVPMDLYVFYLYVPMCLLMQWHLIMSHYQMNSEVYGSLLSAHIQPKTHWQMLYKCKWTSTWSRLWKQSSTQRSLMLSK